MAYFDFCIRPEDAPPQWTMPVLPLGKNSALSPFLVLQSLQILAFHLFFFRLPTPFNYVAFLVYTVIIFNFLTLPTDAKTSNSLGRNIVNLRRAGYSDHALLGIMNFNLVSSQWMGFIVVNWICTDPKIYTLEYYAERMGSTSHMAAFSLGIVANLALAEVLFIVGHSFLHTNATLSPLHLLHHYNTHPSWCTNLLFHPLDLAIEFGLPAVGLFAVHFGVFHDQAILLITYLIFQLWYAYDHDECLNFYHCQHHRDCDSLYAIYIKLKGNPRRNVLRNKLMQLDKKYQWNLAWPKKMRKS